MHGLAKNYLQRYEEAKSHRQLFENLFDECYEYALPQREGFTKLSPGQRRDDRIFDETAVVGVQEFASRLQTAFVRTLLGGQILLLGLKLKILIKIASIMNWMKSRNMFSRSSKTQTSDKKRTRAS